MHYPRSHVRSLTAENLRALPLPPWWAPQLLSSLRIVAGFLFIAHGTQKLFGFPAPMPVQMSLASIVGAAGIIEFVGGALLLAGLFTRPVAFILSGEMAVAYFRSHVERSFWPLLNGGELAALYSFLFLFLAAAGGGPWSADALIRRMRDRWTLDRIGRDRIGVPAASSMLRATAPRTARLSSSRVDRPGGPES